MRKRQDFAIDSSLKIHILRCTLYVVEIDYRVLHVNGEGRDVVVVHAYENGIARHLNTSIKVQNCPF